MPDVRDTSPGQLARWVRGSFFSPAKKPAIVARIGYVFQSGASTRTGVSTGEHQIVLHS